MKVGLKGMLATTAVATTMVASAGVASADGMPGGPAHYDRPALWTGAYVGGEFGWDHERLKGGLLTEVSPWRGDRDVVTGGVFLGYQHQFGAVVLGVEADLIGNEHDNPASQICHAGPPNAIGCEGRIENMFTIGARVGWAVGNFMPYVAGGFASGEVNFREKIDVTGVAIREADARQDGWYLGGGVDWRLARNVVVGIEYRHVDLGNHTTGVFQTGSAIGGVVDTIRQSAESDSVMVRGSLLFNPTYAAAPLK